MERYSWNLGEDGCILSICKCLEGQTYEYENGEFIHDPEPKPEPTA